jgi:Uma2 family endonuclease
MQIGARLMTVEEYRQLKLPEDKAYELRDGELVEMTFPKHRRIHLQLHVADLLQTNRSCVWSGLDRIPIQAHARI